MKTTDEAGLFSASVGFVEWAFTARDSDDKAWLGVRAAVQQRGLFGAFTCEVNGTTA